MKIIIISGIDGSGKSSVIKLLEERFHACGYNSAVIWLRYTHYFVKPVHAIARLFGLSRKCFVDDSYFWRHDFSKLSFLFDFYVFLSFLDACISRIRLNKKINRTVDFVICDRWISDILVDLAVKAKNPNILAGKWSKLFYSIQPSEPKEILILREVECLLGCRPENRVDPDFRFRSEMYCELKKRGAVKVVHNNKRIEDAVEEILEELGLRSAKDFVGFGQAD